MSHPRRQSIREDVVEQLAAEDFDEVDNVLAIQEARWAQLDYELFDRMRDEEERDEEERRWAAERGLK